MKSAERLSVIILIAALGCRKNSLDPLTPQSPAKIVINQQDGIKESDWLVPASWKSTEQPAYSLYSYDLKADAVTDEIIDEGLVRIFKTSDNTSPGVSLPFEEIKDGQKIYWYYEITPGNIMIAADVYGKNISPEKSLFKYLILNKKMVNTLEEKGIHQSKMMDLPYQKMKAIIY